MSQATAQPADVLVKNAADEFEFDLEDEGLNVVGLEDILGAEKPLDFLEEKEKKPTSTSPSRGATDWSIGEEWFPTPKKVVEGVVGRSLSFHIGKADIRFGRKVDVWVDDRELTVGLTSGKKISTGEEKAEEEKAVSNLGQAEQSLSEATQDMVDFWPVALSSVLSKLEGPEAEKLSTLLEELQATDKWGEQRRLLIKLNKQISLMNKSEKSQKDQLFGEDLLEEREEEEFSDPFNPFAVEDFYADEDEESEDEEDKDEGPFADLLEQWNSIEGEREKAKVIRDRFSRLKGEKARAPEAGEKHDVLYNYISGKLQFPGEFRGKQFRAEFYVKDRKVVDEKGKPIYVRQTNDEEYDSVQGLKSRSQNLWALLLNHPDDDFVIEHLIPDIENNLQHLREKPKRSQERAEARLEVAREDLESVEEDLKSANAVLRTSKEDLKAAEELLESSEEEEVEIAEATLESAKEDLESAQKAVDSVKTELATIKKELELAQKATDISGRGLASIPDVTKEMITLEHLLHGLSSEDSSFTRTEKTILIDSEENRIQHMPAGSELRSLSYEDSGEPLTQIDEDEEPEAGEFTLEGGDIVVFSEEDVGHTFLMSFNKASNDREKVTKHIEENIAPKLKQFHSMATFMSANAYDLNSRADDDDMAGLPGLGHNPVALDSKFLGYVARVRGESRRLNQDLFDFTKFHIPMIAKLLQSGSTYYVGTRKWKDWEEKDAFSRTIRPVFEKTETDLRDLLKVAVDAFRKGILEFSYEARPEHIQDPKKFKVSSNPFLWKRVKIALQDVYNSKRDEAEEEQEESGERTVTIPEGGGVIHLKRNLIPSSLRVKTEDGVEFTHGGGFLFRAGPKLGNSGQVNKSVSYLSLTGPMESGKPSPFVSAFKGGTRQGKATDATVIDSTGTVFDRIRGSYAAAFKELKTTSDPLFYLTTSDKRGITLPPRYLGEVFSVVISGAGAVRTGTLLGKNQFSVDDKEGTIEFSPQNSGETVDISFKRISKSKRRVQPTIKSTEEGSEDEDISAVEQMSGGQTPEEEFQQRIFQENIDKIRDVVSDLIWDQDEKRLNDREKVIIDGLFGLGEEGETRLTLREIAQDEPFNYDLSTERGRSDFSDLQKVRERAASILAEILRERVGEDPALKSILENRTFQKAISGTGRPSERDKIRKYLEIKLKGGDEDSAHGLQRFLSWLLVEKGPSVVELKDQVLKNDQENILRFMWSLPGYLRGDWEAEEEDTASGPLRTLPEVVEILFLTEEERKKRRAVKQKRIKELLPTAEATYSRALERFEDMFDHLLQKNRGHVFEEGKASPAWEDDFLKFYKGGKDRDLIRSLAKDEEVKLTPFPREEIDEPDLSLFDRIRQSARIEDEAVLHSLLSELFEEQKRGGDIGTLLRKREELLGKEPPKDLKDLFSKVRELHQGILDSSSQNVEAEKDKKALEVEKENIAKEIRSELGEDETTHGKGLFQELSKASSAIGVATTEDEKKAAQKTYNVLWGKIKTNASPELQKKWKENLVARVSVRKEQKEWRTLIKQQREELGRAHKNPLLRAKLELRTLSHVSGFFQEHPEMEMGKGKYNLKNLFSSEKPTKLEQHLEEWMPESKARGLSSLELDEKRKRENRERRREKEKGKGTLDPNAGWLAVMRQWKENHPERASDFEELSEEEKKEFLLRFESEPRERGLPSGQKTLYELLVQEALPSRGGLSAKARAKESGNFKILMERMRKFTTGKLPKSDPLAKAQPGTVEDFIAAPKTTKTKLLTNEEEVLSQVLQFLTEHAQDIQAEDGSWDLRQLHSLRDVPEGLGRDSDFDPQKDLLPLGEDAEALHNAQRINKNEAKILHTLIQLTQRGRTLKAVEDGLRKNRTPEAVGAIEMVSRLKAYLLLHPEDSKFEELYSGKSELPSASVAKKKRPLRDHISGLVNSIYEGSRWEEDQYGNRRKKPAEEVVSRSQVMTRVLEMLSRMSVLSREEQFTLDDMADHFIHLDEANHATYSLGYLFQQVKNYLHRLNRTLGIQNMEDPDNLELGILFPDGAPLESPADAAEVTPALSEGTPDVDTPEGFRRLVEEMDITGEDIPKAEQLLKKIQQTVQEGNKSLPEVMDYLHKYESLRDLASKIDQFIDGHGEDLEVPGQGLDLSSLTGLPFKPADEPEEQEAIPSMKDVLKQDVERAEEVPSRNQLQWLIDQLKKDSPKGRSQRLESLLEMNAISPGTAFQAVMMSGLPPKEIRKLRSLIDYEEEAMKGLALSGRDLMTERIRGEEEAPPEPVAATPPEPVAATPPEPVAATPPEPVAAPPATPGRRGRLSKTLTSRELTDEELDQVNVIFAKSSEKTRKALSAFGDLSGLRTYADVMKFKKEMFPKVEAKLGKKEWTKAKRAFGTYTKAWSAILRSLPEEAQKVKKPKKKKTKDLSPSEQPLGLEEMIAALKALETTERAFVQQAIHKMDMGSASVANLSISDWLDLRARAEKELSDPNQIRSVGKLVDILADRRERSPAPVPQQAPTPPAPVPQQAPQQAPVDLAKLKETAIAFSRSNNWSSADQFGQLLREKRPDRVEAYETIKSSVQQALDEIMVEPSDFDFSEL
jgi:hypothetical protein